MADLSKQLGAKAYKKIAGIPNTGQLAVPNVQDCTCIVTYCHRGLQFCLANALWLRIFCVNTQTYPSFPPYDVQGHSK